MAAKKTAKKKASKKTAPVVPQTEGAVKVTPREVSARRLIVFDAEHELWASSARAPFTPLEGALIRLRPPPGFDAARVEELRKAALAAGAARVKVEMRVGRVVPREAVEKSKAARCGAREVVIQMTEEANTQDRFALRELVEATMAEVGL